MNVKRNDSLISKHEISQERMTLKSNNLIIKKKVMEICLNV